MDASPVADAAPVAARDLGTEALGPASGDAELLAAMAHGLGALEMLYDRYRMIAFSVAYRITHDQALAEDVVQEAFLGVWRNAGRYRADRGSVKTWLLAMVHHRAIDAIRRRKPVSELPTDDLELPARYQAPDLWAAVSADLDAVEVQRAMDTLSEVQRQAIELAYFGGLTQQEIAHRIETPLGTVKSRIRLGLRSMRAALAADDADDTPMTPTAASTVAPAG